MPLIWTLACQFLNAISGWVTSVSWRRNLSLSRIVLHGTQYLRHTSSDIYPCSYDEKSFIILNSVPWVRERTVPTERPSFVGEVSAKFADRMCHVVSVTCPYSRIHRFLDRIRNFFFQVAPQLYSRGWVGHRSLSHSRQYLFNFMQFMKTRRFMFLCPYASLPLITCNFLRVVIPRLLVQTANKMVLQKKLLHRNIRCWRRVVK
jgi:hypothetical protein